jgi:hypothetical protein
MRLALLTRTDPAPFTSAAQVKRYFRGKTIRCLLCGKTFRRLASHLAYKHHMSADDYKAVHGLPWSRGLASEDSSRNSGWTKARRVKARQFAYRSKFFRLAHPTERRAVTRVAREIWLENLGERASGFGAKFERRVRALFDKGMIDREIAAALGVNVMTVNLRTRKWRKRRRH